MKSLATVVMLGAVVLAWAACPAAGEYITVYGGPTYDASTSSGYTQPSINYSPGHAVNEAGTAVGCIDKFVANTNIGSRAVRWDASGSDATELENLGTDSSGYTATRSYSINDAGIAVGYTNKYVAGKIKGARAIRWDNSGTATELGSLGTPTSGQTNSYAYAVNSTGTAVGSSWKFDVGSTGTRAVRWAASDTAATELGNLGTDPSGISYAEAHALNNAGTAVGSARKYDIGVMLGTRAVRWDASGTAATELGHLGTDTSGSTDAHAEAINNAGTTVGSATKYVSGILMGDRAVRWDASGTTATELDNLGTDVSGKTSSYTCAINDAGDVVGYSQKYDAGVLKGTRAVRWNASDSTATELGNLGTDASGNTIAYAYAINSAGVAVGEVKKYNSAGIDQWYRAVLWGMDGTAVDLNTLIDPASGWTLRSAYAISDSGWVAGVGFYDPDGPSGPMNEYDRLFLMQVPEPATLALVALGGVAAMLRRRKSAYQG